MTIAEQEAVLAQCQARYDEYKLELIALCEQNDKIRKRGKYLLRAMLVLDGSIVRITADLSDMRNCIDRSEREITQDDARLVMAMGGKPWK